MAFTLIEIDFKAARRFIKWIFGFTVQLLCTDKPIVTLYASFIKKSSKGFYTSELNDPQVCRKRRRRITHVD
jgi:hypothetical protein